MPEAQQSIIAPDTKIFVAGHQGMVGSAIVRHLQSQAYKRLLLADRSQLDLCDAAAVQRYFSEQQPEVVIVAAAKVGGIYANATYPADFLRDNLSIALNTIHAAWQSGCPRLLFLGSSCIYPREAPQPMKEGCLLSSSLEKSNEAYAIAKIAGLKLCQYYRSQYGVCFHSLMPTNLYGPGDNYHLENAHVLPALLRRFHQAKLEGEPSVSIWGTGNPRREFLHVDDLARAVLHVLQLPEPADWYNVGTGTDISIYDLAEMIKKEVGYTGAIDTETDKPDGTPRKLLDISMLSATAWQPLIPLDQGIRNTYQSFLSELAEARLRGA